MPFPMPCSACGRELTIPDDLKGKRVRCTCGQVLEVPKEPPLREEDLYAVAEPSPERREAGHPPVPASGGLPDGPARPEADSLPAPASEPDLRNAPQFRWAAGLAIGYGCVMTLVTLFFPQFAGFCCSYYPGLVCFPALTVSGILILQGNPLGVECLGIFAAASAFLTCVSAATILFVSIAALIRGHIGASLFVGGIAAAAVAIPGWLFLWALRLHRKWRASQDEDLG